MLSTWKNEDLGDVIGLWNREAVREGYKEMTEESFRRVFLSSPYFDSANAFVWTDGEGGPVQGFACGCTGDDLPLGADAGYVTCVFLEGEAQTDENYAILLDAIEARFRELGKKQAEVLFFNPMVLPWYIPGTPKHEHNNAPGVPEGSELHRVLLNRGYVQRAVQHAMYLPLDGFAIPEEIRGKEDKAWKEGYTVALHEPERVRGVEPMLDALGNPLWSREISQSAAAGIPVVMADFRGEAVGFAGPVIRQESGRGYFAGIGVRPEHEGHGLGSILFFKLCEAFRNIGTKYMSLYTGSTNPAINIYEKAGFRTVKKFAIMRKGL